MNDQEIEDFEKTEADAMTQEDEWRAWGYPPALIKALQDPFDYTVRLSSGELINFQEAEAVDPGWVRLQYVDFASSVGEARNFGSQTIPRGMDVRIGAIVWIADRGK